ncbi:hypothetical protein BDW02DRAFT_433911 [Decorospora gaudefroyi]|uniref:Uncharacterized protein n=1 Tax=Decorospora gaudefroyi TaxID=184978 RepID=A0A6A5KG37_9PLEO|nr:hypothetical protein BDW02DRAFT_433911 [Decorospora gaudefroyi]
MADYEYWESDTGIASEDSVVSDKSIAGDDDDNMGDAEIYNDVSPAANDYHGYTLKETKMKNKLNKCYRKDEVDSRELDAVTVQGSGAVGFPLPTDDEASDEEMSETDDEEVSDEEISETGDDSDEDSWHIRDYQAPANFPDNMEGKSTNSNAPNHMLYRKATPMYLNVPALIRFPITIAEMTTFLPLHYCFSGFLPRMDVQNKGHNDTARMILSARGLDKSPDFEHRVHNLRSALGHQLPKSLNNLAANHTTSIGNTCSTWSPPPASSWKNRKTSGTMDDCLLLRLSHGVTDFPRGTDQGLLTIALVFAELHGHWDVMLSELPRYVAKFGLGPAPVMAPDADRTAMREFRGRWKAAHP